MTHHRSDGFAEAQRLRKAQEKLARQQRTAARRAHQKIRHDENISFERYLDRARRHTILLAECAERLRNTINMKPQKAVKLGRVLDLSGLQLDTD